MPDVTMRVLIRHITAALLFAPLLVMGAACGFDAKPQQRASNCDTDRDCPETQVCRVGWCSLPEAAGTFDFRFLTPNSSIYVPQSAENVRVDTASTVDFGLEAGVNARGTLVYTNSESAGPSGTIIFRPVDAASDFLERRASIEDGQFQTYVLPGTYELSFVPQNSATGAGKVWPPRAIDENWSGTLEVPRFEALAPVDGTVSFIPEAMGTDQRLEGARVFAVSTNERFTSTTDTTDENGSYTLRVIPGSGTYNLHIQPGRSDSFLPRVVFDRAFTAAGQEGSVSPQNLTNQLGEYSTQRIEFRPKLVAADEVDYAVDWTGTRLAVEGDLGLGMFTQTSTTNDPYGSFEPMTLLPGSYKVTVVPPADSPIAPKIYELQANRTPLGKRYELDPKPRFRGTLVDSVGRPVPNATLEFRPVKQLDSVLKLPILTVETDAEGSFDVPLDRRNYRVVAKPPPGSGQPAHIYNVDSDTLGRDQSYTWELPPPMTVTGTIFGQSSDESVRSVDRTTVEVTRTIGNDVVTVGRAQTRSDGSFRMVLPAVEQPESGR